MRTEEANFPRESSFRQVKQQSLIEVTQYRARCNYLKHFNRCLDFQHKIEVYLLAESLS